MRKLRNILAVVLVCLIAAAQAQDTQVITTRRRSPVGCSFTNHWPMTAATCSGSCSNGSAITGVTDQAGSNNLSQGTANAQPSYDTIDALNGHAVSKWSGCGSGVCILNLASSMCTTGCNMTWFAVVNNGALTHQWPLVGCNASSGCFEWRVNSSAHLEILNAGLASLGTSTSTYASGSWHAVYAQYNETSHVWAFGSCSGGTCTADGSGTTSATFTVPISQLGWAMTDGGFQTLIADIGYFNSATTSCLGSYTLNTYGF